MKKIFLSLAVMVTVIGSTAQKLYVYNSAYISKLGNSEAYAKGLEEENRNKFDNWLGLDINKAVKSVEVDPANGNHVFELFLELDETMHAELKKNYFGKTQKFEKKYPKKFTFAIFLNNNPVSLENYAITVFNQYPNVNENGVDPYDFKFFKGPNNRFVFSYREAIENYTSNGMQDKLVDGDNEIKFVVNYDGKEYATTSIIYSMNKYDHNSGFCKLGEQKYDDADYYKTCAAVYQKKYPKNKLEEIIFSYGEMQMRYLDGVPNVRFNSSLTVFTAADGKMYYSVIHYKEMYSGGGTWGKLILEEDPSYLNIALDPKCIESYRKAMGK